MTVELRVSSFKNVFHTLSYRFDAIISLRFYSWGKGKGMNDYGQGGIADTLTSAAPKQSQKQPIKSTSKKNYFSISSQYASFDSDGGNRTFTVSSSAAWKISVNTAN